MLLLVRERVLAVDSNKLYLPTTLFEDLDGQYPLHERRLWPEHHSLKFTFAHSQHSELQYFVVADATRPEMPTWCAPRMPVAQSRSLNQPQEPLSLLSVGVRAALVPPAKMRSFVKRDWTCVCFQSMVEATRRVAVLTAIAYEPLASRTTHGRLQGRYFPSLHLLSWAELERHEAACAIQACHLARIARKAFKHTLHAARANMAVAQAQRAAERDSHSLLAQQGVLDIPPLQVDQPPSRGGGDRARTADAASRNLTREQLETMLTGQAEVLGVYGLPPVIASAADIGQALSEQLAREAREQREAAASARALIRERRVAEVAAAREASMAAARDKRGVSSGLSDMAASTIPPDMEPPEPPSARTLMQMMQVVVAQRSDAYDDLAATQARIAASKRAHAASVRAELKQAHAELVADRELERQELLVQSRLEKEQLQHALDERNRAFATEVVHKCEARRSAKEALANRATARAFTGGFVRQQNAMVRQLQLGDLRRRRNDDLMQTSATVSAARTEQEAWKDRAAAEARRRVEATRQVRREEKAELLRKTQSVEAARQREIDLVRLKQQQLLDIRAMLARPVDQVGSFMDDSLVAVVGGPSNGAEGEAGFGGPPASAAPASANLLSGSIALTPSPPNA